MMRGEEKRTEGGMEKVETVRYHPKVPYLLLNCEKSKADFFKALLEGRNFKN